MDGIQYILDIKDITGMKLVMVVQGSRCVYAHCTNERLTHKDVIRIDRDHQV